MPVVVHSTGPAAVFVTAVKRENDGRIIINGQPYILGWCERSPEIVIENHATPLYNTLGGVELPYTYFPQGSEAVITCTFTRWNDFIASTLENVLRDTLVLEHSLFTHLSSIGIGILYTYAAAAFGSGLSFHRAVDVFPLVRLVDIVRNEQGGMGEKITMVFAAQRVHVATRSHFLWDLQQMPYLNQLTGAITGFGEMSTGGGGGSADHLGDAITAGMFAVWPQIFPAEV